MAVESWTLALDLYQPLVAVVTRLWYFKDFVKARWLIHCCFAELLPCNAYTPCLLEKSHYIVKFVKNRPISLTFDSQNSDEIGLKCLWKCTTYFRQVTRVPECHNNTLWNPKWSFFSTKLSWATTGRVFSAWNWVCFLPLRNCSPLRSMNLQNYCIIYAAVICTSHLLCSASYASFSNLIMASVGTLSKLTVCIKHICVEFGAKVWEQCCQDMLLMQITGGIIHEVVWRHHAWGRLANHCTSTLSVSSTNLEYRQVVATTFWKLRLGRIFSRALWIMRLIGMKINSKEYVNTKDGQYEFLQYCISAV